MRTQARYRGSTWRLFLVLLIAFGAPAFARQPDGTLGLIRTPNNGIPAIALPGTAFDVVLAAQGTVRLSGAGVSYDLATEWTPLPGRRMSQWNRCSSPA